MYVHLHVHFHFHFRVQLSSHDLFHLMSTCTYSRRACLLSRSRSLSRHDVCHHHLHSHGTMMSSTTRTVSSTLRCFRSDLAHVSRHLGPDWPYNNLSSVFWKATADDARRRTHGPRRTTARRTTHDARRMTHDARRTTHDARIAQDDARSAQDDDDQGRRHRRQ